MRVKGLRTIVNRRALNPAMYPRTNERFPDEKLGRILTQLRALRSRLNLLAIQHGLFYSLAMLIAAGAIVYACAFTLSPLNFMIIAAIAAATAPVAIVTATRTAWSMRASTARAASLADERAELKGRLATIVTIAQHRRRGPMWSYLVEDTLSRSEEFAPARIERRRISKGIFALAGALVLAGIAWPISKIRHAQIAAANQRPDDLTLDLNDLHLRPADPGDDSGVTVSADPATMRQLQARLAHDGLDAGQGNSTSLDSLVNHARDLAGNLQSKLTGQKSQPQRLNLKLADAADPFAQDKDRNNNFAQQHKHNDNPAGQFQRDQPAGKEGDLPQNPVHNENQDQDRPAGAGDMGNQSQGGKNSADDNQDQTADANSQQNGDQGSNGGAAHGIGADPDSLFGAPAQAKLGSEGFEIAIEARPLDKGPKGAGHAYEPPKVRTTLSTDQEPDEPVARTDVPSEDRTTIKRVFER